MSAPRQTGDDTVRALAEVGIDVTDAGKRRARALLAQADAAHTPSEREAARDRYAAHTRPA